jgi:deazaflavin-dependent oxidoreductase (nitroreductase family)
MRGRRSGKLRRTALIYGRDGDNYVIVASKGGSDQHPSWYRNIMETPIVDVQVSNERFQARARTASAAEKKRLWPVMVEVWPAYEEYQARTSRDIPLVILERL